MSQSLSRVVIHLVFSVKNREPYLRNVERRKQLHAYMAGVLNELDCEAIAVGGVEDHIHVLCNLSRSLPISKVVEETKRSSTKWLKARSSDFGGFHWQAGYGVFSVSQSNVGAVKAYVENQEEHHGKVSFQDEFRLLCRKHGVVLDERYVWD